MPRTPKTYTCTCCARTFNGTDDALPPGWAMRRAGLLCDDCTGNGDCKPARPRPAAPADAERIAA